MLHYQTSEGNNRSQVAAVRLVWILHAYQFSYFYFIQCFLSKLTALQDAITKQRYSEPFSCDANFHTICKVLNHKTGFEEASLGHLWKGKKILRHWQTKCIFKPKNKSFSDTAAKFLLLGKLSGGLSFPYFTFIFFIQV